VKIESWMGLAVPKSTPAPIVKRLEESMLKAMQDKELVQTYHRMGIDPVSMTGPEYARMVEEGYVQMGKTMKELGLLANAK
jgi:tripartite-type tricarboxylate transporter receptor subunit TctC